MLVLVQVSILGTPTPCGAGFIKLSSRVEHCTPWEASLLTCCLVGVQAQVQRRTITNAS